VKKILIIDDEKPALSMFRLLLGAYDYSVLTAENGSDGIELFKKEQPPIVITDIKMPGIDGFEVLRQIKAINPEAEIILITGHGDTDLAQDAIAHHACGFITKPIQREALEAALKQAEERIEGQQ